VTLTLIVGALCLALAGFTLKRKEAAAAARSDGRRRGPAGRRDYDDEDDYDRFDYGDRRETRTRRPASRPRVESAARGVPKVDVEVNPGKCAKFGFCEHEAPEIFNLHGDGRLGYKTSAVGAQIDAVERAVKICPARAIKMHRPGSRMYLPQIAGKEPGARPDGLLPAGRRRRED